MLRHTQSAEQQPAPPARFLKVSEVAKILNLSQVTLYRAISEGTFPAVKVRGRYTIPARWLDEMEETAITGGTVVNASRWAAERGAA